MAEAPREEKVLLVWPYKWKEVVIGANGGTEGQAIRRRMELKDW